MKLTSTAFENNQNIPAKYTCKGDNTSPPLEISGVPASARTLALVVHDPDSPSGEFMHWVMWNLDPTTAQIVEGTTPTSGEEGKNDFGEQGYGGPCPHKGSHHYVFSLYALDMALDLPAISGGKEVLAAMQDHIVADTQLVGMFSAS